MDCGVSTIAHTPFLLCICSKHALTLGFNCSPPVNTLQRGTSLGNFKKYYAFTPTWSWGVRIAKRKRLINIGGVFDLLGSIICLQSFVQSPVSYINTLNMPGFMSLQVMFDTT